MKTPCLKCGLIHDEPTAICDGYAGIDPDETADDTRKQAAARIRAILAAVPIESRRGGRARAAAAGASASQPGDTPPSVAGRTEPPPAEVPEWRREVSERLESYRSRRERQSRQGGTNQSVLAFRVHSKSETLEEIPQAAAPAALDAPAPEAIAASPLPVESAAAPSALPAAMDTATPAVAHPENGREGLRTYQPIEESEMTADLTTDLAGLASEISESDDAGTAALAESAAPAEEAVESPAALPIASGPAVVLADSATVEVHADPLELAEVQPAEVVAAPPLTESAPLASIPAIDAEYWRAVPAEETGETECGSLTSGFESGAAAQGEIAGHAEEMEQAEEAEQEEVVALQQPVLQEEEGLPPVEESLSAPDAEEPQAPAPHAEEHSAALQSEDSSAAEPFFSAALTPDEAEEAENRRVALRTAARPLSGSAPERIEIRVPQPVFDFAPADVEIQPREEAPPVADLRERRCAAFIDAALLGLTVAGFFLAFHLAGGEFIFSRVSVAVSAAAAFLIYTQYVLLFVLMGGATPGMVLRGLRVVCFDGRPPDTIELAWRSFGYLLSAAAGMLGFVWSAWDEHGLSWHDRISQTYVTYAEPEAAPAVLTTQ